MDSPTHAPATFLLVPGAATGPAVWTPVVEQIRDLGHCAVPVDLPCEDDAAGLTDYAEAVAASAAGVDGPLVVVGHSFGGFAATAACARLDVDLLVLVQAMVPSPGERPREWWLNTAQETTGDAADTETFLHDVPEDFRRFATGSARRQSGTPFGDEFPLTSWPDVTTRFLLCLEDRFLDPEALRRAVQVRLRIEPDEIESGHLPMLAAPDELAKRLVTWWEELAH